MTGTLVIGLGNPLAGDDGVGWHVADRLTGQPRLPPDTEVLEGGTDLLRLGDTMAGRGQVFLVDAILDDGPPGRLLVFDDPSTLPDPVGSAHQLSPTTALHLLRTARPELRAVPVTFLCISIRDARIRAQLSPELSARLDDVVEAVLAVVLDAVDGSPTADPTDPAAAAS